MSPFFLPVIIVCPLIAIILLTIPACLVFGACGGKCGGQQDELMMRGKPAAKKQRRRWSCFMLNVEGDADEEGGEAEGETGSSSSILFSPNLGVPPPSTNHRHLPSTPDGYLPTNNNAAAEDAEWSVTKKNHGIMLNNDEIKHGNRRKDVNPAVVRMAQPTMEMAAATNNAAAAANNDGNDWSVNKKNGILMNNHGERGLVGHIVGGGLKGKRDVNLLRKERTAASAPAPAARSSAVVGENRTPLWQRDENENNATDDGPKTATAISLMSMMAKNDAAALKVPMTRQTQTEEPVIKSETEESQQEANKILSEQSGPVHHHQTNQQLISLGAALEQTDQNPTPNQPEVPHQKGLTATLTATDLSSQLPSLQSNTNRKSAFTHDSSNAGPNIHRRLTSSNANHRDRLEPQNDRGSSIGQKEIITKPTSISTMVTESVKQRKLVSIKGSKKHQNKFAREPDASSSVHQDPTSVVSTMTTEPIEGQHQKIKFTAGENEEDVKTSSMPSPCIRYVPPGFTNNKTSFTTTLTAGAAYHPPNRTMTNTKWVTAEDRLTSTMSPTTITSKSGCELIFCTTDRLLKNKGSLMTKNSMSNQPISSNPDTLLTEKSKAFDDNGNNPLNQQGSHQQTATEESAY